MPIPYAPTSWNPITGCSAVSPGCEHCWACRLVATRLDRLPDYHGLARKTEMGRFQWTGEVRLLPHKLDQPLHWRKTRTVAVAFMGDLFHEAVPDGFIGDVFTIMAATPEHRYLVLTKRSARMQAVVGGSWLRPYIEAAQYPFLKTRPMGALSKWATQEIWPIPNVWLGVTVENQEEADRRIPLLLQTPAAKRWVSIEPMLGPILLHGYLPSSEIGGMGTEALLDWVILGSESDPNARRFDLDWARSVRNECIAAGVKFYFKQCLSVVGKLIHLPELDGRQWLEVP